MLSESVASVSVCAAMWLDDRGTSWPKGSDSVWFPLCSVGSHVLMLRSFENLSCISISPRSEEGGGGGGICFSFLSFFCSSHTVSRSLFLCHAFCFAWPGDDRSGALDFIFLSNNPKKFTAKVRANLKIFHRGLGMKR